jgi:hypothetical protein
LDISANKICSEGASVIAAAFGAVDVIHNPKVNSTTINIQRSKAKALNVTLQELYLSGNRIGPVGADFLVTGLTGNTTLTVLDVSYQRKSFKIGPAGAHRLAQLLGSQHCKLLTFKCARNNIGFEGCRHLSSALLRNTTLTDCDLGGVNYITVAGALQLGQAIKHNKKSALAWLTVGEHRIPVPQLIGTTPLTNRGSILRIYRQESDETADKKFLATTKHGMDDELGVVVATLVTTNETLETLQVEEAELPIQQLLGNDPVESLDLSGMKLTSIDAIIIGSLIAENHHLKMINLKNNCFGGSEGENFVAYALERNTDLTLDIIAWPAKQMFTDGYPTLAAALGQSASAVHLEPQRLEGWFYQGLTYWSAVLFYVGLVFDVMTLVTYGQRNNAYFKGWVSTLALIMCSPTLVYLYNTLRNMLLHDPRKALVQSLVIIFQATPMILAHEAVAASMESAALLDFKFVQATHKSVPQVFFQTYILFAVGMYTGEVNFWSLVSVLSTIISLTVIYIMLFDRKPGRRISMAPQTDQPYCAVVVARILEVFGMGNSSADVTGFANFDALYTSHYILSYVYQLAGLCPRIISIAWLMAGQTAIFGFFVLLIAFIVRVVVLCLHDDETFNRSIFNNTVLAISLVISDSAWRLSAHDEITSRDALITLTFLTTSEIFIALYFSYFVDVFTLIPVAVSTSIFAVSLFFVFLRWLMMYWWALHVHFPRLYLKQRRRGSHGATRSGEDGMLGGLLAFGWNPFHKHKPLRTREQA